MSLRPPGFNQEAARSATFLRTDRRPNSRLTMSITDHKPNDKRVLADRHRDELHASGITDATIAAAGVYSANDGEVQKILGRRCSTHDLTGIVYPYCDGYVRIKPDSPRFIDGKPVRYESPRGKGNRAYFPPGFAELEKQGGIVVITEGEKKALAVSQLDIACIGLVGVWGWQVKRSRTDSGKAYGTRRLIPDLEGIDWKGRQVVIVFDSDAATDDFLRLAESKLSTLLQSKGATVLVARIAQAGEQKVGADDLIVADGADAFRALLAEAQPAETPPTPEPMDWARMYLDDEHRTPRGVTLRWHHDEFYAWTGTHYRTVPDAEVQASLLQFLDERGAKATGHLAGDVRQCLASEVRIPHDIEAPVCVETQGYTRPNWIAFQNGLLPLNDQGVVGSGVLSPHTPNWFSTFALPYDYHPDAKCPVWFQTLDEIFDGDEERVDLLGEWFGYCQTDDTTLHAILLLEGPRRSGKSTILRTLAATIGRDNCVSPTLSSLQETFGLWPFLGKRLAYCPDAHLGHGDKAAGVLERIKCISGEDPVDVHRKHLPTLTNVRLRIKFALAVNELPKFGDSAGALGPRVHILPCRNSFEGKEDRGLERKITAELPGIFNWGIEGLGRLRRQGEFTRPAMSREVEAEFARLVSPLKVFVEDRCIVRPAAEVSRDDLWVVWKQWCEDNGHTGESKELPGSKALLGSRLRAMIPGLDGIKHRQSGREVRFYVGLSLRDGAVVQP